MTIQHINAETGEVLSARQVARLIGRPQRWEQKDKPRRSQAELRRLKQSNLRTTAGDVALATLAAMLITFFFITR